MKRSEQLQTIQEKLSTATTGHKSQIRMSIANKLLPDFLEDKLEVLSSESRFSVESAPAATVGKLYHQMHQWSVKASSKIAGYLKEAKEGTDASTEYSRVSDTTATSLSMKMNPLSEVIVLHVNDHDTRSMPMYLDGDPIWASPQRRRLKNCVHRLTDKAIVTGAGKTMCAIIKFKKRLLILNKTVNVSAAPPSSIKIQWRISRYLMSPTFLMLYSMLCRFGSVVALIKLTPNSALCVFETTDEAANAIYLHSINQSFKLLILRWWYPIISKTIYNYTNKYVGTRWLLSICDGLDEDEEMAEGDTDRNTKISRQSDDYKPTVTTSFFKTVPYSLRAARKTTRMKLLSDIRSFTICNQESIHRNDPLQLLYAHTTF